MSSDKQKNIVVVRHGHSAGARRYGRHRLRRGGAAGLTRFAARPVQLGGDKIIRAVPARAAPP